MSGGETPRNPDPAEENIRRVLAGGEPAAKEPPSTGGELVRVTSNTERFLMQYIQRDGDGKKIDIPESTKRDIRELGADYERHKSIKELLDLMRTMRAMAKVDVDSARHMLALTDYVNFMALHDAGYQKELYDTRMAAEAAKKLAGEGEAKIDVVEPEVESQDATEVSENDDTTEVEVVEDDPSLYLTDHDVAKFHEMFDEHEASRDDDGFEDDYEDEYKDTAELPEVPRPPQKTFDNTVINDQPFKKPRDKRSHRKNLGDH